MKTSFVAPALAGALLVQSAAAISLDDIQLWTGAGTNRAALVIEWNSPEYFNGTTVPAPVADKALVWGYRFNGAATGLQMFNAVVVSDPRLYAVESVYAFGTSLNAIGYNLTGGGLAGVTDGTVTNLANSFTNGLLVNPALNLDATASLNRGDLFWSSGFNGPYWLIWNETNDAGGFFSSPNRGTNAYWTATDTTYYSAGFQGQWAYAQSGLDGLQLTNGSWIGLTISAAGYPSDTNDPSYNAEVAAYDSDELAPVSPDGTYAAYIANPNDFAVEIVGANNVSTASPYNSPGAVLGRPTLQFYDLYGSRLTNEITKVVEPEYWTLPDKVTPDICKINAGGYITVKMGSPIYHNPNNPYGEDFIIFGNSFYVATGGPTVDNFADMGAVPVSGLSGTYGHTTTVSVSQDGTNWFTYPYVPFLLPSDAYQWDDCNHIWKNEVAAESKPVNPALNFTDTLAADVIDQYVGANGGTGYSLQPSGLPWIQYIRVWAGVSTNDVNPSDYTVVDAIGAVHPAAVGDALSITPANLESGVTNLSFQDPANLSRALISINFDDVSATAKISTVSLHEFSSFAPVAGNVLGAYQLQARPLAGATNVALQADLGLYAGQTYSGNGGDLRVYQWNCTNWVSRSFTFDSAHNQVVVAGVTNLAAFVVSQIVPPNLRAQSSTNGFALQFAPIANCEHVLERSADLVHWTPIYTNTPAGAQPVAWQDAKAPAGHAYYRVLVNVP